MLIERVGFFDGRDIEAPVLGKLLIFRRHDRERQIGRNPIQINPIVAVYIGGVAACPRRSLRLGDEGGDGRIDPPQRRDGKDARGDAPHDQPHDRP